MSNPEPTHQLLPEEIAETGAKMDRAARAAAADAIRTHRAANVPMAIWEDEQVKLVSPFDIPLPEDAGTAVGEDAQPRPGTMEAIGE